MEPARSVLFTPGNRESWVASTHENDADVVILNLDDSVPPDEKDTAREIVPEYLPELHDEGQRVQVRVNGHPIDSEAFEEELDVDLDDVDVSALRPWRLSGER